MTNFQLRLTTAKIFNQFPDKIGIKQLNKIFKYLNIPTKFSIHDVPTKTFRKNFIAKLYYNLLIDPEKGCWTREDWSAYTSIYDGIKTQPAHRASYQVFFKDLQSNKIICHHCDRPGCRNPFHLFQGTSHDNMCDHIIKSGKIIRTENPEILIAYIEFMMKYKKMLKDGTKI